MSQNYSDVTEILTEMHVAGVATDKAVEWIARAIKIGKASERVAQEEARRQAIRETVAAEERATREA